MNRKLCSGEGSTWPWYRHRICNVSFSDMDDEEATRAFLATTLVEESIRSRFRNSINLGDEQRLLKILERVDRHTVRFARKMNVVRPELGDVIANAYEKRTATERLSWLFQNDKTQLMFEVSEIRKKRTAGMSDGAT